MFSSFNFLSLFLLFATVFQFISAVPVSGPHVVVKEVVETRTIVQPAVCAAPHSPTSTPARQKNPHGKKPGGRGGDRGGKGQGSRRTPKVLAPGRHPNRHGRDKDKLRTCTKLDLYYGEPSFSQNASAPTNTSMAVVHIPHMNYPAVELMGSDFISDVSCNATTAEIKFNDPEAYAVAAANWTQQAGRFVMLSTFEKCRNAAPHLDNEYIVVDKVVADDTNLIIQAEITHSDFEEVVGADTIITVDLGTYAPGGPDGFNATAASASVTLANTTPNSNYSSGGSPGLDGFDADLDQAHGSTIAIDDAEYQQRLFPGLNTSALVRRGDSGSLDADSELIYRRGLFDWLKKVADTIVKGTVEFFTETIPTFFTETLPEIIDDAIEWVEQGAIKVAEALDDFLSINKEYTGHIGIDYYPSNSEFSVPGLPDSLPAYQLYADDNIQAYCVQCGADGEVTITGTIAFSVSKGFTSGKIAADGSLRGTVALGLTGTISQTFSIPQQHLVTVALSDLVLGSLVQIGPAISLGAGADLTLSAAGELLAGVTLEWPAISASLDIVHSDSHAGGFTPQVTPIFHAAGRISASTDIYALISLELAVSVLAGAFKASVALVDRPGVVVTASVAAQADYNAVDKAFEAGFLGGCAGVGISANVYNKLYVDVLGLYKADLHHWESEALETCLGVALSKRELADARRRAVIGDGPAGSPALRHRRRGEAEAGQAVTVGLSTADGMLGLRYARNGNIYAIPAKQRRDGTELFAALRPELVQSDSVGNASTSAYSNSTAVAAVLEPVKEAPAIIYGTAESHILHAYRNELDTWGVSRLRVADPLAMPSQSVVMALGEVDVPAVALGKRGLARRQSVTGGGSEGTKVVVATDTGGERLWPVVCNFEGLFSKVFLVRDLEVGVKTLMGEAVKGRLFKGGVQGCGFVPFVMG